MLNKEYFEKQFVESRYQGIVLKIIACKIDSKWKNYFTSFTFANEKYLSQGDYEWHFNSGEMIGIPEETFEELKSIVEFNVVTSDLFLLRKNLSFEEFYNYIDSIQNKKQIEINNDVIEVDVGFSKNEFYSTSSHSDDVFKNANSYLTRMSDVLVGWALSDEIFTIEEIFTFSGKPMRNEKSELMVNGTKVQSPISTLTGFLESHIENPLCGSVVIYYPHFKAWFAENRFDGKTLSIDIWTEDKKFIRKLKLLYRAKASQETLFWDNFSFKDAKLPKKNQVNKFVLNLDRNIDTSLFILVDKDFKIHDFSPEVPYLSEINLTLDVFVSGSRKSRSARNIGDNFLKNKLQYKRAIVKNILNKQILFSSGQQKEALVMVKSILDLARNEIKIIDPYFGKDKDDWLIFSDIAIDIPVKIISSLETNNAKITDFNSDLGNLRSQIQTVNVKSIYSPIINSSGANKKKCPFHDRFYIIDNTRIWAIGTSVNGLGKRDSIIFEISSENYNEINEKFDYYWANTSPIHKELINNSWVDFPVIRTDF